MLSEELLSQCFSNNPDGAGFCIEQDGILQIHKGFFTFESFYSSFKLFQHKKALIHFRIKTHGALNTDNCHPFFVSDEIAFIHNGIISGVPISATESDTIVFNNLFIKPTVQGRGVSSLHDPVFQALVEKFIGGSKLAFFIKGQEEFLIYNQQLGNVNEDGVWFSNMSWKPYTPIAQWKYVPNTADKGTTIITKPLWETTALTKVPSVKFGGVLYEEGAYVTLRYGTKDKFGPIPKGSGGFINAVWNTGKVDVDLAVFGLVINIHPAQLEISPLQLQDLPLDTWECEL